MSISEIRTFLSKSKRTAPNPQWLEDEVQAIWQLGISDKYLSHIGGKKVSNNISSTVAWMIGITDEEPWTYPIGLEVDKGRGDYPDVDIDIEDRRRGEVKQYLTDQYKFVASIATFQEFKDKNVVRDVARVFQVPLSEVNRATKQVETWDDFISSPNTAEFRNKYPEVILYAEQLRGRIRGTGVHASGIVASSHPLSDIAPIEVRRVTGTQEDIKIVAVDMEEAADIGLIKLDFLGLKALSVVHDTIKAVKERHGIDIDPLKIPTDDDNVYKMLSDGHTLGVFQCEAAPYTSLLTRIGVKNFNELAATNALVRPGAANTIGKDYIARKHGKQVVKYPCNEMKPFLEDTYGCILYQEQVMLACTTIGGMTMAEADKVRKIIGKKKDSSEFKPFQDKFVSNATKFVGAEVAEQLWHDFEAHAGYSFNKSHAVAYSLVGYWTAWLKLHYTTEFIYAALKNEGDKDTRTQYLIEAKRLGIPILLPHINKSEVYFSIEDNAIRIGLSSIKYLSDISAKRFIDKRPFNSYKEVEEFVFTKGSGVNSRALSSMNLIGALAFDDNKIAPETVKANLYEYLNLPEISSLVPTNWGRLMSDTSKYDEVGAHLVLGIVTDVTKKPTWGRISFMDKYGAASAFCNPDVKIEKGKAYILLIGSNRVIDYVLFSGDTQFSDSPLIKFLEHTGKICEEDEFFILSFQSRWTKKKERMGTVVMSDSSGELHSMVVFPSNFLQAYARLEQGKRVKIETAKSSSGDIIFKGVSSRKGA